MNPRSAPGERPPTHTGVENAPLLRRLANWLLLLIVILPAVQPLLGEALPWTLLGRQAS